MSNPARKARDKKAWRLRFKHSIKEWLAAGVVFALLVAIWRGLGWLASRSGMSRLWASLTPSGKYLLYGTLLLALGVFFLRVRFARNVSLLNILGRVDVLMGNRDGGLRTCMPVEGWRGFLAPEQRASILSLRFAQGYTEEIVIGLGCSASGGAFLLYRNVHQLNHRGH